MSLLDISYQTSYTKAVFFNRLVHEADIMYSEASGEGMFAIPFENDLEGNVATYLSVSESCSCQLNFLLLKT